MTRTKIIATLGPASLSDESIVALIKAGVDIFRLNMSHGERDTHRSTIRRLKKLPARHGLEPVGILADLSGPKIRVGRLAGGSVKLMEGAGVTLHSRGTGDDESTVSSLFVSYAGLGKGLKKGAKVLIDDGMLELKVVSARRGEVACKVVKGGTLKEHKGVNFPGMPLELPSMTDKDEADLEMLLGEGVDYIALSFVREAGDVEALKEKIRKAGSDVPVIAKIERPEAVKNIRGIVKVSDAVMVARGDLGVEMAPELVPPLQKRLIRLCNEQRKPVITATQMLESMIWNPRPTRAEASDVAGAVFDGTDALMLSGETAEGRYPEAAVRIMDRIAREAERHLKRPDDKEGGITGTAEAIAYSACNSAAELGAKAVICFTRTGSTALLMSKFRPDTAIIAATPDAGSFKRMRLYFGVTPVMTKLAPSTDRMIKEVERSALARGLVREGDTVVVTLGVPVALKAPTNLMKVHRVGERFGR